MNAAEIDGLKSAAEGNRQHVLVIDDEEQVRCWVRSVLEEAGFEVEEAEDGVSGMKRFRQRPPALVICDVFMPRQEGLETIKELHRLSPQTRIIAMSGGGTICTLNPLPLATRMGAVETLRKPFSHHALLSAIHRAMGNSGPVPGEASPSGLEEP